MTLVVFDMDGTLLNKQSRISSFTADTLAMMRARNIRYTVATGRTLQAAVGPLEDHHFVLPMMKTFHWLETSVRAVLVLLPLFVAVMGNKATLLGFRISIM